MNYYKMNFYSLVRLIGSSLLQVNGQDTTGQGTSNDSTPARGHRPLPSLGVEGGFIDSRFLFEPSISLGKCKAAGSNSNSNSLTHEVREPPESIGPTQTSDREPIGYKFQTSAMPSSKLITQFQYEGEREGQQNTVQHTLKTEAPTIPLWVSPKKKAPPLPTAKPLLSSPSPAAIPLAPPTPSPPPPAAIPLPPTTLSPPPLAAIPLPPPPLPTAILLSPQQPSMLSLQPSSMLSLPVTNRAGESSVTPSPLTREDWDDESVSSHCSRDDITDQVIGNCMATTRETALKGELPDLIENSKMITSSTHPSSGDLSPHSLSQSPYLDCSHTESAIAQSPSPLRDLTADILDADKPKVESGCLLQDPTKLVLNILKPAKTADKKESPIVSFYIPRQRLPPPTAKGTKLTKNKPHLRLSGVGASKLLLNRVSMRFLVGLQQKWTNIQSLDNLNDWLDLLDLDNVVLVNLKIIQFRHHFTLLVMNMNNFMYCCDLFDVLAVVAMSKFEYMKLDVMREIASKDFVSKLHSLIDLVSFQPPEQSKLDFFLQNLVSIYGDLFMQLDTLIEDDFANELETLVQKCLSLCSGSEKSEIAEDLMELQTIIIAKDVLIRADSCYPYNILQEESVESNIIVGPFDSFDQYLSIHYRLLKEDFQDYLRVGIGDYLKSLYGRKKRSAYDHLFVYHEITLSIEVTDLRLKYKITFTRPKEIDKAQGNRTFCNGSLLLLTYPEKPFAEYFLAKVDDSSPLDNKKKFMYVSIILGPPDLMLKEYHGLLVVEPARFFEPYYRVLNVIRSIEGNNFPFLRYLVDVQTDISPPYYMGRDTVLKIDGFSVPLWDDEVWPLPDEIGLNVLQLEGLKLALRNELAIIQGPPGTGKTYLSMKIIEVLLQNKSLWHNQSCDGAGMILVVCYKNQSLDQLLGNLLKSKRKVVRLGLRSKDENLDEYNLKSLENPKCTPYYYQLRRLIKGEQKGFITALKQSLEKVKIIDSYDGLIKVDLFFFVLSLAEGDLDFLQTNLEKWLLECPSEFQDVHNVQSLLAECTSSWAEAVEEELDLESDFTLLTFHDLNELLGKVNTKIDALNGSGSLAEENIAMLSSAVTFLNAKYNLMDKLMRFVSQPLTEQERSHIEEINDFVASSDRILENLPTKDRWLLYKGWVSDLRKVTVSRIALLEKKIQECMQRSFELQEMQDLEKLAQCDAEVIGMTTTAAARYYKTLHYLKPRIVLVEEAAEVVEAHTIAALSEHTAHLILVGDHKQLRPMTSSHLIGRDAHLDISMYERLVKNKFPHCTLNTQYRMRPEIAALISPSVYTELINHELVKQLPNVLGIKKNLFFVDHAASENKILGGPSVWNEHEAEFHMALCDYLLKQGYQPSQITVLATYAEQERYFIREKDKYPSLLEVQFASVDSFQGKENDIILLSLVRSNNEGNIGFLGVKNRINVALSRARIGLFITGNSKVLSMKNGLWPEVLDVLKSNNSIGRSIPLRCQVHGKITELAKPKDFSKVANGGCSRICNESLKCRHKCERQCHPLDREHNGTFKCQSPCGKPMLCNHKCDLGCHFLVESRRCLCLRCCAGVKCNEMLLCGHSCEAMAHVEDPDHSDKYQCNQICDTMLKCGHVCRSMCHTEDPNHQKNYKCPIPCEGTFRCGHPCRTRTAQKHECSSHSKLCCKLCDKVLSCGHKCHRFAHIQDRQHKSMYAKCIKCTDDKISSDTENHELAPTKPPPCSPSPSDNIICSPYEAAKMSEDASIHHELCWKLLKCGHKCDRKLDHEFDRDHKGLCIKPCCITLKCGHSCRKVCHPDTVSQDHQNNCDTCLAPKPAIRRNVEQAHLKPESILQNKKRQKCNFKFGCGHKCLRKEHCEVSQHTEICKYKRLIKFRCGHNESLPCCEAPQYQKKQMCRACTRFFPK